MSLREECHVYKDIQNISKQNQTERRCACVAYVGTLEGNLLALAACILQQPSIEQEFIHLKHLGFTTFLLIALPSTRCN